jgi:YD repeat-containing protein
VKSRTPAGLVPPAVSHGAAASGRRHFTFANGARNIAGLICAILSSLCIGAAGQAVAASPTLHIGTGVLISPSTALTNFGAPTSPTPPTTRDPLVQETARSLGYNIDTIFAYVRDHVELTPSYGLEKGARGVIMDHYGTSFDQAQALVDMLREADAVAHSSYAPQFVLGQISLAASDFANWFGVTDADAARHVLADGGIPATVTGTGSSFTVVMSHVWVTAAVGGTRYVFDPSYKPHTTIAGVNVATAMSYNGATLLSAGTTGASTNTATSIQGFNFGNFQAALTGYRANLETYLTNPANNLVGARVDYVAGHRSITAHPTTDNRRTSLPYATSADQTWTGQIPNIYRTSFSVQLSSWASADLFYADEVYGTPLLFSYVSTASPYAGLSRASIVPTLWAPAPNAAANCDNSVTHAATLNIAISHPYPVGSYMSRTLTKTVQWTQCSSAQFVITNDWGDIGERRVALMRQAMEPMNYIANSAYLYQVTGPQTQSAAAMFSAYLRLAGQSVGGDYQLHDLIGVHELDTVGQEQYVSNLGGTTSPGRAVMLTMDFEAGVSANPNASVNAPLRSGMIRLAQGGLAAAESSVSRQEGDGVRDITSLTLLTQNPSAQTSPYYLATPATWASTQTLLTGYPSAALTALGGYIGEGYSLLLPKNGQLGQPSYTYTDSVGNYWTTLLQESFFAPQNLSYLFRPTFFAFNPTTGDGAYLIYDPQRGRVIKGGVDSPLLDATQQLNAPKPPSKDVVFADLKVSGQTGDLSYTPPVDITDGAGKFPASLSIQRRYDPTDSTDYGVGIGWKTNWRQAVTLANDGQAALGSSGAFGAASALVAIQAVKDLSAGADDPQHLLAEAAIQQWFVGQAVNNVANVANGLGEDETFLARSNGTFVAAKPDGAKLVMTGQSTDSLINKRIYQNVSFDYTGSTGDVKHYIFVVPTPYDLSQVRTIGELTRKDFNMTKWSFPSGVSISLSYTIPWRTDSITNNLGASLSLSVIYGDTTGEHCDGDGNIVDSPVPGSATYTTPTGQSVKIGRAPATRTRVFNCNPQNGDGPGYIQTPNRPLAISFTDQTNRTWSYGYTPVTSIYDASTNNSSGLPGLVRLSTIAKPSAPPVAAATIAMGLNGQVHTITDGLSNVHAYLASDYYSAHTEPLGDTTQTFYDEFGRTASVADALGRTTGYQYDNRNRTTVTTNPELDSVVQAYDVRSNLISTTRNPKPGSALSPLVASRTYNEGPTVLVCANIVICNSPASDTDALSHVSNYSWNAATGQLTQILKPADSAGVRPQTDFAYSLYGPAGSQFYLLSQVTDKVSASQSVITSLLYDAASRYVPKSETVDPGSSPHLNLTTCFKFDAVGNLISSSDPRTGTCP